MLPYYILIGAPLVFAISYELLYEKFGRRGRKKNYTSIVFFAIYFFLLAFRSKNVGADIPRYLELYEDISSYSLGDVIRRYVTSDIGYYLCTKILSVFFSNGQWLLIAVALITVIPIAKMYYKESKNSLVSIALFMVMPTFQMNFSGLRQAIAIAFIAPAIELVKKKELAKFVCLVLVAMTFHKTAFILLAMYPLYHSTIKLKQLLLLIPVGLLVYRFNNQLYMFAVGLLGEKFQERYAYTTETGAYTMLIVFLLFSVYAYVFTNEGKLSNEEKGYRNFLVMALFLQMFAPVNSIAMRMNYYFIPFIPIVITQATNNLRINDKRVKWIISVAIYILFTVYYLDKSLSTDSLGIYPYEMFM